MPVYPFSCPKCSAFVELLLSIEDYEGIKNDLMCPNRRPRICGSLMQRVFTPVAIIGGHWDWKKGYRTGINDSAKEVRYDMMRLEQSMTEEGNLKKHYEKKRALAHFAEAHQDILKEADLK